MAELYKIGTVAKLCGVPAHVIRYYEDLGLISSQHLNGSSTRYYDPFVFEQLLNIRTLRRLEFSIDEIQNLLSSPESLQPINSYRLWDKKQKELLEKINSLQGIIGRLSELKQGDYYQQIGAGSVITVSMPVLYFFPQMKSDHSPIAGSPVMEDILEKLEPFNRKFALAYCDSAADFGPVFGAAVSAGMLDKLSPEQRAAAVVLPAGEYYLCSAMVDRDCVITPEHARPLYEKAAAEGRKTGRLMFELGLGGCLRCMLQRL